MSDDRLRSGTHFGWTQWFKPYSEAHRKMLTTHVLPPGILSILSQKNFRTDSMTEGLKKEMKTWLTDPDCALDDDTYQRLQPALWLASRFITASRDFFNTIWYGDEVVEDHVIYLDHTSKPNTSIYDNFLDDVLRNTCNFQIFLGQHDDFVNNYATHRAMRFMSHKSGKIMRTWSVQLNWHFTQFYTHPSYHTWSKETIERTHLLLAVTIVHELMHACHSMKFQKHQKEPFYYRSDPEAELGRAWERWAFAGILGLNGGWDFAGSSELHVYNIEDSWYNETPAHLVRATHVTDPEVSDFFDSDCWRILHDLTLKKTNLYDGLLGSNFIDNMQIAKQIKDWQATHGRWWPNPQAIQPFQPLEDKFRYVPSFTTACHGQDEIDSTAGPSNTADGNFVEDTARTNSTPQNTKPSHVDELAAAFGVALPPKQ